MSSPPKHPLLVRTLTTKTGLMDPKATNFNESINLKRKIWYKIIHKIILMIKTDLGNESFNTSKSLIFDTSRDTIEEKIDEPLIYILGGAAYASYDEAINEIIKRKEGLDLDVITDHAPRTHDWDVSFCLKNGVDIMFKETIKRFPSKIKDILLEHYDELNGDEFIDEGYFSSNFDKITVIDDAEEEEDYFDDLDSDSPVSEAKSFTFKEQVYDIVNEYIEISFLNTKTFQNIRINLQKTIDGKIEKNHIIELVLWTEKPRQDITYTVQFKIDDSVHYLPNPYDLFKSNVISMINRSVNNKKYAKCRQDYMRLNYMIGKIYKLEPHAPFNGLISPFIKNLIEYVNSIEPIIKQCYQNIPTELDRISIEYDMSNSDFRKIKKLLHIMYSYSVIKNEIIDELKTDPFFKRLTSSTDILDDNDLRKYLKYKTKYLKLKNKKN
jgi:hypothetical protein